MLTIKGSVEKTNPIQNSTWPFWSNSSRMSKCNTTFKANSCPAQHTEWKAINSQKDDKKSKLFLIKE